MSSRESFGELNIYILPPQWFISYTEYMRPNTTTKPIPFKINLAPYPYDKYFDCILNQTGYAECSMSKTDIMDIKLKDNWIEISPQIYNIPAGDKDDSNIGTIRIGSKFHEFAYCDNFKYEDDTDKGNCYHCLKEIMLKEDIDEIYDELFKEILDMYEIEKVKND